MFSTSMPTVMALAATTAIQLVRTMQSEREELRDRARSLRERLRQQGWNVGGDDSPIIPIFVGDPNLCVAYSISLLSAGCFVPAIRPPTVPVGKSLLRISLSTAHHERHIQHLLSALGELQLQNEISIPVNRTIHERNA